MNALFRLDNVAGSVTSLLRGASGTGGLTAVDSTRGVRGVLGLDYNNSLANRLLAAKKPIEAAGGSRTDASALDAVNYSGFTNRAQTEHAVSIRSLASSAQARSEGLESDDVIKSGTLTLSVHGATYNITLAGGLSDVVDAVRASGAAVEVGTTTDGVKEYLTIRTRQEGYSIGGVADDALSVSESYSGTTGKTLDTRVVKQASNAEVTIDGQSYVRQSNTVSDALPGTTLRLEALAASRETTFVNQPFKAGLATGTPDGIHRVAVKQLATSAEAESQSFASSLSTVRGGSLELLVAGLSFKVPIAEGSTLGDVAHRIQQSGAAVDVSVKTDGAGYKLNITSRATGHTVGGTSSDALRVTEEASGTTGQALGIAITKEAVNAKVVINGGTVESPSNVVRSALPGFTLELKNTEGGAENLLGNLGTWKQGQENLSDASNEVFRVLQDRLITTPVPTAVVPSEAENTTEVKAPTAPFNASDGQTDGGTLASASTKAPAFGARTEKADDSAAPKQESAVAQTSTKRGGSGPFGAVSNEPAPNSFAAAAKAAAEASGTGGFSNILSTTKAALTQGTDKAAADKASTDKAVAGQDEVEDTEGDKFPFEEGSQILKETGQARTTAFGVRAYQTYLSNQAP